GEKRIRPRLLPHPLTAAGERRARPAGDVVEGVVGRRGGILVPPVAAAEAPVAEADTGVGLVAVHRASDSIGPGRGGAVALAAAGREAVSAYACRVRPRGCDPAAADTPPRPQLGG